MTDTQKNANALLAERQGHIDTIHACQDLLRPDSGWNKLIAPILDKQIERLTKIILSGDCESILHYKADTSLRLQYIELRNKPEEQNKIATQCLQRSEPEVHAP